MYTLLLMMTMGLFGGGTGDAPVAPPAAGGFRLRRRSPCGQ